MHMIPKYEENGIIAQTSIHTDRQRETDTERGRHRQRDEQTDVDREADRRTDRQTDTHNSMHAHTLRTQVTIFFEFQ